MTESEAHKKLRTPVEFVKGVGPQRAELLKKELEIFTVRDLLEHFPFRYVDKSQYYTIREMRDAVAHVQVKGTLVSLDLVGQPRRKRLVAHFQDATGSIELVWFKGVRYIKPSLTIGKDYVVFGKPNNFNGKVNVVHPEIHPIADVQQELQGKMQPVYGTTEKLSGRGLNSRGIEKLVRQALKDFGNCFQEFLPQPVLEDHQLINRILAYRNIHFPSDANEAKKAIFRIKFEELFLLQLQLARLKKVREKKLKGLVFDAVGHHFTDFYENHLPFELTGAQKRVLKEIRKDTKSGHQMNRLLQGDVGSGKTIVSVLTALLAIDNGFQVALMAPTEILAQQHYEGVQELLAPLGVSVDILTGSKKTAARRSSLQLLLDGHTKLIIGTHALLEDRVQFQNLGMVIIDEQHRFGVAQRARLWQKNETPPHILVMTATPIPRTLAMTVYGDLDVSVIDELPPGRKPITTIHRTDNQRLAVWGAMRREIDNGRQAYVVFPLIKESEKLDYKDLMDGYEGISRAFPIPKYQVSVVHGQMSAADKEYSMQRFVKGETHIMVATTVIEVGVNVPNASVMIIESAERFGLSQLHQLRGRVGRGAEQSYCILMTGNKLTNEAKTRMKTMCDTNDGFRIAEVDMELRGPGDIMGTQQSGMLHFKLANLASDGEILGLARHAAWGVVSSDANLEQPEHALLRIAYKRFVKANPNWSRIS